MPSDWQDWVGREEKVHDHLSEARAAKWLAAFDMKQRDMLPQGIHFCVCTPDAPTAKLGPDGHPSRDMSQDSFMPPIPEDIMPRRMWASSKIRFCAPIATRAIIQRVSRISSVTAKSGDSGALVFVDVEHTIKVNGTRAVEETQTIVYRPAAAPDAPLSPPVLSEARFDPSEWDAHRAITPDPSLLFRYSALTFNTHRIHYDAPYTQDVERYRGLVVHGPLIASLLLQLAASELGNNQLRNFAFRAKSPAIADEMVHLVMRGLGDSIELAAFADDGREVMAAKASV